MMNTTQIRVEPEVRFYLPNAFTPNDDRLNDQWGPRSMGWAEFELWVYDRWGNLIFQHDRPPRIIGTEGLTTKATASLYWTSILIEY